MKRLWFSLVLAVAIVGCANAVATSHDAGVTPGSDAGGNPSAGGFAGHGSVAGGVVANSAHYKLIGTLTSGNGAGSSQHYVEHSGVLGVTQK